nr:hypothetical protein BaRGS_034902 [Batillaria attramentaria]
MMTILDRASYAAKQWTDHLAGSAVIGQDLYLTISHPQRDEGAAYIIPQQCRVKPESGNFTTLWTDQSGEP